MFPHHFYRFEMAKSPKSIALNESILKGEKTTLDGRPLFHQNLYEQLFQSGNFSDVTLVVGNRRFPVHKCILAASSTYLQQMFCSGGGCWMEGNNNEIKLDETPSCQEVFESFLSYFYSGAVIVSNETVIPILTLADKYGVQGLIGMCTEYIAVLLYQKLDVEAALRSVEFAEQLKMEALQLKCYDLISCNFEIAFKLDSWSLLSLDQILTILKRSDIIAASEYTVFEAVQAWLIGHFCTKVEIEQVLSQVQFKNMTVEELCQVEKSDLASLYMCKQNHLLVPHLKDAFRFIALKDHYPNSHNESAQFQRIYSDTFATTPTVTYFSVLMSDGAVPHGAACAWLEPICTFTPEANKYKWQLRRSDTKYQLTLPSVSRKIVTPSKRARCDFPTRFVTTVNRETKYLCDDLPGDISLDLVLIISDRHGCVVPLRRSFVVQIPKEGQVIAEFPDDCPEHTPQRVSYTFSIEKACITIS